MCDITHLPDIDGNLYLGSMKTAQTPSCVQGMRILCVANGDTCNDCKGTSCAGTLDVPDAPMNKAAFDAFTVPGAELLKKSLDIGPTLVHCYAGINRSASVVARYAIDYKGMRPHRVLSYIRSQNSRNRLLPALTNTSFESHLLGGVEDHTAKINYGVILFLIVAVVMGCFFLQQKSS